MSTKKALKTDPEVEPELETPKELGFGAHPTTFFVVCGTTWLILVPFLTPSDFEWGSKIDTIFETNQKKKKRKRRSKKRLKKNMIC